MEKEVRLDLKNLRVSTWSCHCFYDSPCQEKAKLAISHWSKFCFYHMCIVRIHIHTVTNIQDALVCQVITSLLICGKWFFSNVLIMQIRWVTINPYFSDFLVPVPHLNVWTVFHTSLAWVLFHFYQVFCLVFIFPLILHPAPIQGRLPWFVFTCCTPGSSSFPLRLDSWCSPLRLD